MTETYQAVEAERNKLRLERNAALQQMNECNEQHVKALGEIHRLRDRLQNRIRLCPCRRGDCKTCQDDMKEL